MTPGPHGAVQTVAYLVNLYPAVSHTFIRREIHALERHGMRVQRIALRGWAGPLVDPLDHKERECTHYVLREGLMGLLWPVLSVATQRPVSFVAALIKALRLGRRAFRPSVFHLVYLAEACRILRTVQAAGADHLHAHFGSNAAELALLVHVLGGPRFSFTVHGPTEFDQPRQHKLREKAREAAFVVAISSHGKSQLLRWADPRDWSKVHVVHCGIEPTAFAAAEPAAGTSRLVCVGRLCAAKGQLLLVDAVARLVREGIPLELVLAGDGEMRSQIESRIESLGLSSSVRITGWLSGDQVRAELMAARALVLPSFAEGLPVVIMEAMAVARPVISTYVAGIPELVRNGECGWLVPAGDLDSLVVAMKTCIQAEPPVLRALGQQARERVVARHNVTLEAAKLAALFHRAAAKAEDVASNCPHKRGDGRL